MSSEEAFKGCFRIAMGKDHITVPDMACSYLANTLNGIL